MSAFAKAIVSGPGAEAWLDGLLANRIPKKIGRVGLCHLLSANGGVRAEFTVCRTGPQSFYLVSAGALERHDHDIMQKALPRDGSVSFQPITAQRGVLVIAGPNARALLQKLTDTDLSSDAFPWLSAKEISIGPAVTWALRVNFVGELGWELHHPIEMQNEIFDLLFDAGKEFGVRPFGIKAMLALAVEKSYRLVGRELSIEYAALESGLDRFVHPNKGSFHGRDALNQWRERGFRNRFVTLEVHDVTDADARGSEPVLLGDELVGRCTQGAWGWRVNKSLALAMVRPDLGEIGQSLTVQILGKPHRATVIAESPYDPDNVALRS
jgi:dimethylglycine dehydrogenase